jgi:tetratricopeptide (TPR) repeat protein
VLDTLDRFDEAEAHYREALTGLREVSGDESLTALGAMNNLGHTLKTRGRLDEAEPFYREVLAGCRRLLPADHPNTLITLNNLAYLLEARGDLEAALPFFQEALDGRRRSLRPDHPMTRESINRMGAVQRTMGELGAALSLGAEAVAGADREMPVGHLFTGWFRLEYARTLAALGRFGESDAVTREAGAILQEAAGVTPQIRSGLVEHAVSLYEAWHAADPSGGHEEQAAAWRDKRDAAIAP